MIWKKWDKLPSYMKCDEVRRYYDILSHRKTSLFFKRLFDIVVSLTMILILIPVFLIVSIAIIIDSKGGVFFCQKRVTTYGKEFKIFKFRTMVTNAEKIGSQVTTNNDIRVTSVGKVLRHYRLDELMQLFNVLCGDMTFVGTRPEVIKYVEHYTDEMKASFLLPAGITSEASIMYKDENELLDSSEDIDDTYINNVLPMKMRYNLTAIEHFNFWLDIKTMIKTVLAICGKKYENTLIFEDVEHL